MAVALLEEYPVIDAMGGDAFDRRLFDHLTRVVEHLVQERRKVRDDFPMHTIFFRGGSLIHRREPDWAFSIEYFWVRLFNALD